MITPTVGRVVYFRPGNGARSRMHIRPGNLTGGPEQPCRADIVYVWNDRNIAVNVDDHEGQRHYFSPVVLIQDGEKPPKGLSYCEWMPYQKAVAKGEIAPTLHAAGAPHVSTKGTELDSH